MYWMKVVHRAKLLNESLFSNKDLLIKYGDIFLTGAYFDGKFYYYDVSGDLEQLMFQKNVTHIAFISAP